MGHPWRLYICGQGAGCRGSTILEVSTRACPAAKRHKTTTHRASRGWRARLRSSSEGTKETNPTDPLEASRDAWRYCVLSAQFPHYVTKSSILLTKSHYLLEGIERMVTSLSTRVEQNIHAVRAFNRFYTRQIGVLREGL